MYHACSYEHVACYSMLTSMFILHIRAKTKLGDYDTKCTVAYGDGTNSAQRTTSGLSKRFVRKPFL